MALRNVVVVALVALAACGAALGMGASRAKTPWCFTADIKHRKGKAMRACADTESLCREAFGTAQRYGELGGLTRLSACRREP